MSPPGEKWTKWIPSQALFSPYLILSPGGKKCLKLGSFFPRGKESPRHYFPPGESFDGGKKCLLHRELIQFRNNSKLYSF